MNTAEGQEASFSKNIFLLLKKHIILEEICECNVLKAFILRYTSISLTAEGREDLPEGLEDILFKFFF